jgi:ABC-type transport system involved in multi-copper enzyme maturation permease subunit
MLIYKEIERKTFYLLLPKPIRRTEILIGKCLGLLATTTLVTILSTLVLYAVLYIQSGQLYFVPILLSLFLSIFEAMILILISLFFSSITSPILASVSTIVIFLVGHAGDIFRYIFTTSTSVTVEAVARFIYYIFPNLEKFNIRNELIYGTLPSGREITVAIIYAITYGILLLVMTQIVFKKKDF